MNKFIQSTKKFFSTKPVRIVIALIIIAAIMTGVSFGVIALVKALSGPCDKQPGTTWDNDLKTCVKDSCQMDNGEDGIVCKAKGKANKCIAKNYCDYIGLEGSYSYDEDSCMCKLDCSALGSEFEGFTKDGLQNEIDMQKVGDNYIPVGGEGLTCGFPCDIANNKFCEAGYLCAKSINYDKQTKAKQQFLTGDCLNSSEFVLCDNDKKIACRSKNDCTSDDEGNVVCKMHNCGDDDNKVMACTSDSDCGSGLQFINSCISDIEINGKSKHFKKVKYCTKTDKSSINKFCLNKDNIGENSMGNIVSCDSSKEGVSAINPQCPHTQDPPGCAKNGLCENGWQAIPSGGVSKCFSVNEPIPNSLSEGDCCMLNRTATDPFGNQFCCIKNTQSNPSCLNKTTKPYSAKLLNNTPGSNLKTMLQCTSDLEIYNKLKNKDIIF